MRAWWILIIFVILEFQKSTPAKLEKFSDDKMDLDKMSKRDRVAGDIESTDTEKVSSHHLMKINKYIYSFAGCLKIFSSYIYLELVMG